MGEDRKHVSRQAVDRFGLVDCPHRDHGPALLSECSTCSHLVGAITGENGRVVAIRCAVPRTPGTRT